MDGPRRGITPLVVGELAPMAVVPEKESPARDGQWELLLSRVVAARCQLFNVVFQRIRVGKSITHPIQFFESEELTLTRIDSLRAIWITREGRLTTTVPLNDSFKFAFEQLRYSYRDQVSTRMRLMTEQYRTSNEAFPRENNVTRGFNDPWREEFKTLLIRESNGDKSSGSENISLWRETRTVLYDNASGIEFESKWRGRKIGKVVFMSIKVGRKEGRKEATRGSVRSTTRRGIKRNGQGNKHATRYHSYNEHVSFRLPVTAWTPSRSTFEALNNLLIYRLVPWIANNSSARHFNVRFSPTRERANLLASFLPELIPATGMFNDTEIIC